MVRSPIDMPEWSDSTWPITDRPPWNASTTAYTSTRLQVDNTIASVTSGDCSTVSMILA